MFRGVHRENQTLKIMRPYLAVIKDSFRAAMSSKVLYVMLIAITLLLLLLAPVHLREVLDWKLGERQLRDPQALFDRMVHPADDDEFVGLLWSKLPTRMQNEIRAIAGADRHSESEGRDDGEPPRSG